MVILAWIFTISLITVITSTVFILMGHTTHAFEDVHNQAREWFGVVVCLCMLMSYIGVLIRITMPIYRFFAGM